MGSAIISNLGIVQEDANIEDENDEKAADVLANCDGNGSSEQFDASNIHYFNLSRCVASNFVTLMEMQNGGRTKMAPYKKVTPKTNHSFFEVLD